LATGVSRDGSSMPQMTIKIGGSVKMKTTTLRLNEEEYWLVIQHKALLRCATWEAYLVRLLAYPRQRRAMIYEAIQGEPTKTITMRVAVEIFDQVNEQRKKFFKPWREFVLEAAYEDGTVEAYHLFCANSKIVMNTEGVRQ